MSFTFEQFANASGHPAVDFSKIPAAESKILTSSLEQFNKLAATHAKKRNPSISVVIGILDYEDFNASAFTAADVIGINRGLFRRLLSMFMAIAGADVMSWIGAEDRISAAVWLFEAGKHFFFFHELGHIWNGHTRLVRASGIAAIEEIRALPGGGITNLDLQTFEMDADGFAVANIFHIAVDGTRFPYDNVEVNEKHGPNATSLMMLSMAIYFVFRMFDDAIDIENSEAWDHPSSPLRQFLITRILIAHALKTGAFSEKQASELSYTGAVLGEAIFAKIFSKASKDVELGSAFGETGVQYSKKLLRHWKNLYSELNRLKPGGVLPAPQDITDD